MQRFFQTDFVELKKMLLRSVDPSVIEALAAVFYQATVVPNVVLL